MENHDNQYNVCAVSVTGGSYMTKTEQQLDESLESSRLMRDKLGGAVEQWRSAANFLRTSAKSAFQACENWGLAGLSKYETLIVNSSVHFCLLIFKKF